MSDLHNSVLSGEISAEGGAEDIYGLPRDATIIIRVLQLGAIIEEHGNCNPSSNLLYLSCNLCLNSGALFLQLPLILTFDLRKPTCSIIYFRLGSELQSRSRLTLLKLWSHSCLRTTEGIFIFS